MTHGSLFSGIGGFDLAAEWMGWENVFHCEWEDFPKRVLNYYWPNAVSYDDITKTDFTIHRGQISILTGGFPCQPYSAAGKRLGKEDDRHLWPEMLRAIREIQPCWVVGENVLGLTNWNGGLVFEEVQADLEAEGYEVQPFILPAAAVNAPHRRDRVWFVAYAKSNGNNGKGRCDSDRGKVCSEEIGREVHNEFNIESEIRPTSFTEDLQRNSERKKGQQCGTGWKSWSGTERTCSKRPTPDTECLRSSRQEYRQTEPGQPTKAHQESWWENFPTQSPIRSGDDGLSSQLDGITFPKWRNESIKSYGNAIVPKVVYQIFKAIEEYERTNSNH